MAESKAAVPRDWEAASRARLERLVAGLVQRIHDTADEIEREARDQIENASSAKRFMEFQTYPRVVGLIINKLSALGFNTHMDNLIDVATDAEKAHDEKARA